MHTSVTVKLPPQTWTLAAARHVVDQLLDWAGVSAGIRDDLAVAVTEACSNVVRHASDAGDYRLMVDVDDSQCVMKVCDVGPGFDPDVTRSVQLDGDGGRGLLLIRALVDDLRFERKQPGMSVTMIKYLHPHADTDAAHGHAVPPVVPIRTVSSIEPWPI